MKIFYNKGITVIEIVVVLAILVIIIGVTLPSFQNMRENQIFKTTLSEVVSTINKARGESMSSVNSQEYGVHFESDQVVIFSGTVYSDVAPDNVITEITSPASISDIDITGGGSDLYFDRLTGAPDHTAEITVSTTNLSDVIVISGTGIVSIK
jgi:Tfp pilus assembly protein FimT